MDNINNRKEKYPREDGTILYDEGETYFLVSGMCKFEYDMM